MNLKIVITLSAIILSSSIASAQTVDSLAQHKTDSLSTLFADKSEEKNRNVMLSATVQSKPREISIGLPGTDWGAVIFEDGLPVSYSSWPVYYYFRWAGGNSYSSQGLMKTGETAIRSSSVGYAINSYTKLGEDKFAGAITLSTSHYGLIRADANVSGPMGKGWYYSVGAYVNYDPTSVYQKTRTFVNQSQIYKVALTKRWGDKTNLSLLYKYVMNNDGTYGYNTAPFYYNGDGSITPYEGFRMGRDSYFPTDDAIEYTDIETGRVISNNLSNMNRKNLHDATILFAHKFDNGWEMNWNTRFSTTKNMDNLGIFEAGINDLPDGLSQQRMALLCRSNSTDLLSTVEFTRTFKNHSLRLGVNEWNSWQMQKGSSFMFAHKVDVEPQRVYQNGKSTWGHNMVGEYYNGYENKSVLYATDDWMITPKLNVYYGARLECFSIDVNSANNIDGQTNNTRIDGFNLKQPYVTLNNHKKTWLNAVAMAQVYYQIANKFNLFGEYIYNSQQPGIVSFKYAALPSLRSSETHLGRIGVTFNSQHLNITSLLSIINNSGNNGAGHYTKLVNGVYETQTGSSVYDIQTLGWTTDLLFNYGGFSFHFLATLQSPKYKNFSNRVTFSDGSVETFDYSDKNVSGVSKVLLEIDPSYQWNKWRVWASARYYSRHYANKLNNVWFNGHWETFAGVDYKITKNLNIALNFINLLNQTGANGTIDVADTITDESLLCGYLTAGTFIRPFTLELSVRVSF